jgi:Uri superfamily endonuclease
MKGCYVLIIELKENKSIQVGKIGNIPFKKGYYAYIGSALNGLEQRINRHLGKDKKIRWHIDYLLLHGEIIDIFYKENDKKEECNLAKKFEEKLFSTHNFGCSDCRCKTHLFSGVLKGILYVVDKANMTQYPLNAKT